MKRKLLSWLLVLCMVFTMVPTAAFAADPGAADSGLCAHHTQHDESCGYAPAQEATEGTAEIPCDKDCTDTDGDGEIDHAEDCAYTPATEGTPAVEGTPCGFVCTECAAAQEPVTEEPTVEEPAAEESATLTYDQVVALFEALPSADSITEETSDEDKQAAYATLGEAIAALEALTEDEQAQFAQEQAALYAAALALNDAITGNTAVVLDTAVSYLDANGEAQEQATYTTVAASSNEVTWPAGWYVVSSDVTISDRITISGAVNLILVDGAKLTASSGITVETGNSLTIYGQAGGTGELEATGSSGAAGIGGGDFYATGGIVIINGGTVIATGGNDAAGIGGGRWGNGGEVTINGGTVTATGGDSAAGIGGGARGEDGGDGGTVTINGGTVTATGGNYSAGIGGGYNGANGTLDVAVGMVVKGGASSADTVLESSYNTRPQYMTVTPPHKHCVCGGSVNVGNHSHSEPLTYTAIDAGFVGGELAGSIYLDRDITLTSTLTVASGKTLNLCLNGHKLSAGGGAFSVITNGGTLNLCDCNGTKKTYYGKWNEGKTAYEISDTASEGADKIAGGVITGANKTSGYGGGINNSGTANLYSGTIAGNTSSGGGGISCWNAIANLYAVSILSNKASIGGGISVDGTSTVTMYGGAIKNNVGYSGGGVYISHSTSAKNGTFTLAGGVISGNTASNNGGGIFAGTNTDTNSNVTLNLQGGVIQNNTASSGGGVYVGGDGDGTDGKTGKTTANISGDVTIKNNKKSEANNNLYLKTGKTINITDTLTNTDKIGVSTATAPTDSSPVAVTGSYETDYSGKFTSDNKGYEIYNDSGTVKLRKKAAHTKNTRSETLDLSGSSVTYYTDGSTTATKNPTSENIDASYEGWAWDTDGATIDGKAYTGKVLLLKGTAITVPSGGDNIDGIKLPNESVTIVVQGENRITLADNSSNSKSSSGIDSTNSITLKGTGTLNIQAGTASGQYGSCRGIVSSNGDITVDGTTITIAAKSNQSNAFGIFAHTTFTLQSGSITATATKEGSEGTAAGIYANDSITLAGGTVNVTGTSENSIYGHGLGSNSIIINGGTGEAHGNTAVSDPESVAFAPAMAIKTGSINGTDITWGAKSAVPPESPSSDSDYTPPTVTVPVSSEAGSANVSATVSGGTASVTVTDKQLESVIDSAKKTGTVSVDVSGVKNTNAAKIPAKVVKATAESDTATGLQVSLPTGSVKLDAAAVDAVNGGKDVTISVENVKTADLTATQKKTLGDKLDSAVVVDVNVLINGVKQTNFNGGKVTVSMPYTPKAGEDTSKLTVWYIGDDGSVEHVGGTYDAANKCFVFITTHLSQYVLVRDTNPFTDVSQNDWFYAEVRNAVSKGWFSGTSATTVGPLTSTTRGMLVTVLHRMEGEPAVTAASVFEDVASGAYYANGVNWAQANGIVSGYGNGKFGPQDNITREQMAAILYRYAAFKGYDVTATTSLDAFTDTDSVSGYAVDPMKWAVANGLISGKGNGILDPKGEATRAQVAAILTRFDEAFAK